MPFVHRLRVRYAECDMQGVVFNAHWYTWMDDAYTELHRSGVGPLSALHDLGLDFVVAASSARYLSPGRYDDELEVAVTVAAIGTSSMTTDFTFTREGQVLVEGRVRHVCIDRQTWTKAPWPHVVRTGLTPYLATTRAGG